MFSSTNGCVRRVAAVVLIAGVAGCSVVNSFGPVPTEADFATLKPGMTRDQVLSRVGRPTWVFGVRQDNLTILNYRFNHNDCTIYQVSVRPDGTVQDIAPAWDPGCDGPSTHD